MIALSIKAPMRFPIKGVRTPLLTHGLPVTAVLSQLLVKDSSTPARAPANGTTRTSGQDFGVHARPDVSLPTELTRRLYRLFY